MTRGKQSFTFLEKLMSGAASVLITLIAAALIGAFNVASDIRITQARMETSINESLRPALDALTDQNNAQARKNTEFDTRLSALEIAVAKILVKQDLK